MMKVSSASPTLAIPGTAVHSGNLNKLSGRAFLYPGSWKKKYCVLDSQRLFFFDSKEDEAACLANPERISSYINLEYYDSCEEAAAKEVRKASNVFVVSSSDKSFFESGRYYFSAETLPEMNEWINKIRLVMDSLRKKGSPLVKQAAKKTTSNQPAGSAISKEAKKDNPSIKEENTNPATEDYATPNLEEVVSEAEQLDCITRQRVKGPAGRRLPRQRFALADGSPSFNGREQRSGSLSLLDSQEAEQNRAPLLHNRSFDVSAIGEEAYWSLPPPGVSFKPVYAYSSSDESLNASFSSAVTDNEKKANHEKKTIGERPILTGKRNCKAVAKPAPSTDHEAVETLAEEPTKLHSSTPSLPLLQKPTTNWLSIGSSSTAPSVVRQKHRPPARSVVTLAQMEATWTRQGNGGDAGMSVDDTPADSLSLGDQLRGALEQIHGLRAMLALLESDSSSARRDMGSLQENLTTVQSTAAAAAEKVVRMQTQVNNIERQVSNAVKEAQNVQQKANDALAAATAAERDFRNLEDQCRTLMAELRKQQQQAKNPSSQVTEEEIPDTLDETRPPLTPNFSIGSLVSSSTVSTAPNTKPLLPGNDQARPLPLSNGFLSLQPPTSFDFASILSAKCNSGSPEAPRIKSALKSDGKASAKSISFGPTTTFQDPSSPLLAPDLSNPFATSTLRKVAPKIQTSDS